MSSARVIATSRELPGLWWVLGCCVTIPILVWWQSVGDIGLYLDYRTPPGQLGYVFSKLVGLYALFLAWVHILLVLLKQSGFKRVARRWTVAFHRAFGFAVLGCIALHVALFVGAASMRADHLALVWLAPNFTGYYNTAVTLGLFGFYGIVVVAAAGILRAAGRARAAWVHYAAIPVFACAYVHSVLIGTETRDVPVLALYAIMGISLLVAFVYRWRGFFFEPFSMKLRRRRS